MYMQAYAYVCIERRTHALVRTLCVSTHPHMPARQDLIHAVRGCDRAIEKPTLWDCNYVWNDALIRREPGTYMYIYV